MPNQKRKWTVEAELEKKTEPILKSHYPWNPRAALGYSETASKPPLKQATSQYQALLQNRETD